MYKQFQLKRFEIKVSFILDHFHFVSHFEQINHRVIELFLNNESSNFQLIDILGKETL